MTTVAATVFVVDDDPSVRKSLTRLIALAGYPVEAFASAAEFLARERQPGPCCLVLDVRMPGITGLELQETLAGAGHRMPIVFVTGQGDVAMSVRAMKAGALDFLTKPFDAKDLLVAIERAVARDLHDLDDEARVTEVRARVRALTPREAQVFALVVTGMLNKQIAADLGIAEKTVKVHRARVMDKMRAASVAELVRLADRAAFVATRDPAPGVSSGSAWPAPSARAGSALPCPGSVAGGRARRSTPSRGGDASQGREPGRAG
ncbi:MAG TPA: response regulator transcription factor [Candidatus Tectomicrobia bacterium]|nr:response regulator transcription factor [Candidatus Tectomicrobia bacterium]